MAKERDSGDPGAPDPAPPPGLAGVLADKPGNRYEGRWTVACLGSLLKDEWESIDLEPYDGFKIEFHARRRDGCWRHAILVLGVGGRLLRHDEPRSHPGGLGAELMAQHRHLEVFSIDLIGRPAPPE